MKSLSILTKTLEKELKKGESMKSNLTIKNIRHKEKNFNPENPRFIQKPDDFINSNNFLDLIQILTKDGENSSIEDDYSFMSLKSNLINKISSKEREISSLEEKIDLKKDISLEKEIIPKNNTILNHYVSVMFLSPNDEKTKFNELILCKLKISDKYLEFKNEKFELRIPLHNMIYVNQKIIFPAKNLIEHIPIFYKKRFKKVIEQINIYCNKNRYINEKGFVILTSNQQKHENSTFTYSTHDAILIAPSQAHDTSNSNINLEFVFEEIMKKFSQMLENSDHLLETQNFDSSYKFELDWRTELNHKITSAYQIKNIFASLNKEGIYLSGHQQNNNINNFIQASRYDQYINCQGSNFSNKTLIFESSKGYHKVNDLKCCIEYDVNWYDKPYKEMFCSVIEDKNKCTIEINFFKHFFYRRCMEKGIEKLITEVKNNYTNLENDLDFINKIRYYSLIVNLKKMESLNLLNKLANDLFYSKLDYDLLSNNLDELFLRSVYLMKDINVDMILRYGIVIPPEKYITNNYIKNKIIELDNHHNSSFKNLSMSESENNKSYLTNNIEKGIQDDFIIKNIKGNVMNYINETKKENKIKNFKVNFLDLIN